MISIPKLSQLNTLTIVTSHYHMQYLSQTNLADKPYTPGASYKCPFLLNAVPNPLCTSA